MNTTQIQELEQKYKSYILKLFLKKTFFACIFLLVSFCLYLFFNEYEEQKQNLNLALKEKKELNKRLEQARIKEQKTQILQEKKQVKNASKEKKIQITSYNVNSTNLKKKFYDKKSVDIAISLSRFYMHKKDYEKSILWSLKANSLDKNSKESWLLFAEAKKALGKEEEAKKVLKTYTDFYGFEDVNFDF